MFAFLVLLYILSFAICYKTSVNYKESNFYKTSNYDGIEKFRYQKKLIEAFRRDVIISLLPVINTAVALSIVVSYFFNQKDVK